MAGEATYAQVSASMNASNMMYRSVKFLCEDKDVKDVDIIRALMVQCNVEAIEKVHPMPGNYWVVVFKSVEMAEEAQNGFILKEKKVHPKVIAKRFVTATVAYAPPDATLGEIQWALEQYAEMISIQELYVREFPEIRNGRQRVVLKLRDRGMPSFVQIGQSKASLFFAGRVSCCPYCEEKNHLGRDCPTKHIKRCFTCGETGHIRRNCTGYRDTRPQPQHDQNNDQNNDRKNEDNNRDGEEGSMEINEEQAAERDSTPSVSVDMAGVEELSDSESSDSSVDTLIEVPDDNAAAPTTTITTPPTATKDAINIVTVDKETEEVLAGLFSPERPTKAESEQQRQETEDENTQVLFTDPESTPKDTQNTETTPKDKQEEMDTQQNLKRKPLAKVDLRLKLGQSPKPRRSPKHKRRNEKV